MENNVNKKFTWVIKNFSSLRSERIICSDHFVIDGCIWRLVAYPKGYNDTTHLSLYMYATESKSLPYGWRRHARFSFTIVNQIPRELSPLRETQNWFHMKSPIKGFRHMFPLNEIFAKDNGFLVTGDLKIVAEFDVLEVIGPVDVLENTSRVIETMDVNGFQILSSQVQSVNRLFDKTPSIVSKFRINNQDLRTKYMNVLLSLIDTVLQLLLERTEDGLVDAYAALDSLTNVGFELDWLENKLDEISERKAKEDACETRMEELEEDFEDLKQKWSEVEDLMDEEKAELLVARDPLSDDDMF